MGISIVKKTSTLISDVLLVFINYWRTQMKLLDIHFVSWWLKINVDYLINFPDLFIDYWYVYIYIILFFRALEILQEDVVVELMVKHVIQNAIIATKNLHIIHIIVFKQQVYFLFSIYWIKTKYRYYPLYIDFYKSVIFSLFKIITTALQCMIHHSP